jgi:predicted aspartyl protease
MGHVSVDVQIKGTKLSRKATMFVDTGSTRSIIPYKLAEEVGAFKTPFRTRVKYGDGNFKELVRADVIMNIMGRETPAVVLLDQIEEPILGVDTLEALGLAVDPASGKLKPTRSFITRA